MVDGPSTKQTVVVVAVAGTGTVAGTVVAVAVAVAGTVEEVEGNIRYTALVLLLTLAAFVLAIAAAAAEKDPRGIFGLWMSLYFSRGVAPSSETTISPFCPARENDEARTRRHRRWRRNHRCPGLRWAGSRRRPTV